jgi:hypothetical protein
MSDPWSAPDRLYAHLWDRLARGAAEGDDPFRLAALATMGAEGAEARMVALRRADRQARAVEVHSDLRTAKVAALRADPRGALLFWDAETREQLRLSVRFDLLVGPEDRWADIPEAARLNYGTDPAPGTPVAAPEDVARVPRLDRFAALPGRVERMDAVSLAHDPHRRARFEGPDLTGAWVAP